jgi:hypothetical protein
MRLLISVGLILVAGPALAEDQCIALLKHGIYDIFRQHDQNADDSTINRKLCANYKFYQNHEFQGQLSGQYMFGVGSGQGGFSDDQVQAIGQAMCDENYSQAKAATQHDQFSRVLDQGALDLLKHCGDRTTAGLSSNITPRSDTPNIVTIQATYSPPPGVPGRNRFSGLQITSEPNPPSSAAVICDGTLFTAAKQNEEITPNLPYTMTCDRRSVKGPEEAFMTAGGKLLLAAATRIVVDTTLGPIIYDFPEIPKASPPLSDASTVPCEVSATLWACKDGGLLTAFGTACDDPSSWGNWKGPDTDHPINVCQASESGPLAVPFYLCSKGGIGSSPNFCDIYIHGSSWAFSLRAADSTCAHPQTFITCVNGGAMGTSGNFCGYKKWSELGTNAISLCRSD